MSTNRFRNRLKLSIHDFALESLESRKLLSTATFTQPSGAVDVSTFDPAGKLTNFTQTNVDGSIDFTITQKFNASEQMTSRVTDYGHNFGALSDAEVVTTFNGATGHQTSYTETLGDGSMDTATFNSNGQETSSSAFDASGNLTSQQSYIYSPGTNTLASYTSTNGDGSRFAETFYSDGHVSSIVATDATGAITQNSTYAD